MSLLIITAGYGAGGGTTATTTLRTLPAVRSGQVKYLIGTGDSIAENYPSNDATLSYERYAADVLGVSYDAIGYPGQTTAYIKSHLSADTFSKYPSIVLVEGGINDLDQGIAISTVLTNLQDIIYSCLSEGILVVWLPISPISKPAYATYNTVNTNIDSCNAQMISWINSGGNPNILIADYRSTLCEASATGPSGNLWQIKAAYDADGVHWTTAGNGAVGQVIGNRIKYL